TRALPASPTRAELQPVPLPELANGDGRFLLTSSRTLYTSLEGATIRAEDADKLHREAFLEIHPQDAAALGIQQTRPVVISNGTREVIAPAALTYAVAPGSVYLPLYFEGGAVNRLLSADGTPITVSVRPA